MKLKHGDKVMVIAGKDAGKESRITRVIPDKGKVLVEGVNTAKRHRRPTGSTMQGGIIDKEGTIHISNVALYDEKKTTNNGGTRTRNAVDGDQKIRVAVRSGTKFPNAGMG